MGEVHDERAGGCEVETGASPAECTFARTTECLSADLERRISPCQFGGNPDCSNCGCMASAGLDAIARHRLPGGTAACSLPQAQRDKLGSSGPG